MPFISPEWERKEKKMKRIVFLVLVCCALWVSLAIAGDKVVYTVKPGDTLGELMYTWRVQGVEINKLHVWNADLGTQVKVGQKIAYYLSNRADVKKLTDQEIQRVVAETMARMEKPKEPAPVQATKQEEILNEKNQVVLFVVVMVVFLMILAFFVLRSIIKPKVQAPFKPIVFADLTKEEEIEGYLVRIRFVASENKWCSPFRNAHGDQIFADTKSRIIGSVSRCLKSQKFSDQLQKLLASGEVKKL